MASHTGGRRLTLSDSLPFVYGGVASCVAEAATYPIDTAKTRLQLQGKTYEKYERISV